MIPSFHSIPFHSIPFDPSYITANPHIAGGLTWANVRWALTTGYAPYGHPLTWLSHLTDVQFFGLDAGWHHLTNVVLHVCSVGALFELFRRMTGALWKSAFVAAIFAVHPLHVESVAWVAERKDVLSTLLVWLTMLVYVRYVRRPGASAYAFVVGLFALALMAKPMVVTLPVVLLLLDVWPLARVRFARDGGAAWMRAAIEKLPLMALAAATSVATVIVQQQVGAVAGFEELPLSTRTANAIVACVRYLGHAIWPAGLAAFYPYPRAFSAVVVLSAVSLLTAITVAALAVCRSRPYVLVGWVWFLVTISPVLGFLQAGEQAMADRFMYVPLVGLTVIVAWGLPDLLGRWAPARAALPAAATLAAIACAIAANAQTATWRDSVTLWTHALSVTSDNYLAEEDLAQALRDRGDLDAAVVHYQRALANAPPASPHYYAVVQNDLGFVLMQQGKPPESLAHFEEAVRLYPEFVQAQTNLGNALAASGRVQDSIDPYEAAVKIDPSAVEARVGLGSALIRAGRAVEAQAQFARAVATSPSLAEAHNGLGSALALQNRPDEAAVEYAEAIRLNPDLVTARFNLGVLLLKQGRTDEARRELEAALRIDPGYAPARQALGAMGKD